MKINYAILNALSTEFHPQHCDDAEHYASNFTTVSDAVDQIFEDHPLWITKIIIEILLRIVQN